MLILPLKFIREEDKKVIGANLFNLAKLNHNGFSVVECVVAVAPQETFKKVIEKYQKNFHNLKDQINNLNKSLMELQIPESLKRFDLGRFSESGKIINANIYALWQNLLQKWSSELISKIERGEKNILEFTPQMIVFSSNFPTLGIGFFDEDRGHVVIKVDKGKLEFKESEEIEKMILAGNKKLLLPQVYFWVIEDGKIKIIKIAPFTQSVEKKEKEIMLVVPLQTGSSNLKTATKIFLDYKDEVLSDLNSHGIILRVESINIDAIGAKISKLLNLRSDLKVIFYPGFGMDSIKNLEFAKIFLFFRNKQSLVHGIKKKLDASIVLPRTVSKDEYIKLKTDFASIGIYSKGSLKIWKEFGLVQDFLNLDDYLDAGFDGALIDLDKIVRLVTGVDAEVFLKEPKIDWISAVEKFFIELGFSKLAKNHKQVMVIGESVQNEELLNYFIKSGVWGIGFKKNILEALHEHISFIEKQTVKKLIKN